MAAFKKSRFTFTRREPEEPDGDEQGRDVFNEKPSKEDLALAEREAKGLPLRYATINTSYGEIRLKLFPMSARRPSRTLRRTRRMGTTTASSSTA